MTHASPETKLFYAKTRNEIVTLLRGTGLMESATNREKLHLEHIKNKFCLHSFKTSLLHRHLQKTGIKDWTWFTPSLNFLSAQVRKYLVLTLLFGHVLFNYLSSSYLTGFPHYLLDTLAKELDTEVS